ncbi:MAG: YkvA family protein [Advenella sp.]|nr:YkvA family protein [Advenella sp.]
MIQSHFSNSTTNIKQAGIISKIARLAKQAGRPVIEKALFLFFAVHNPKTPAWAKRVIYGALAYLVLPVDAIPDLMPIAGFTDDLGIITAALATVSLYITADVKQQARQTLDKWFE